MTKDLTHITTGKHIWIVETLKGLLITDESKELQGEWA
jgi:hypothetical protein